ncbi:MAG: antirestriction protein ArdA, partial [Pseudomonadota bacterium]
LHGAWIDAAQDVGDLQQAVQTMLEASPEANAEEWAIHGFDGFEGAIVSEYEGLAAVSELAAFVGEHGALGADLYNHCGGSLEEAETALSDHYHGEFASLADFAQELTESTGEVPRHLEFYIDYEKMGRDMALGDMFTIETGYREIHVFWTH